MGKGKDIVITVYGHKDVIDNIAVSLFDKKESKAELYCDALSKVKLEGGSWVYAKVISESAPYPLNAFFPTKFDIILNLDDRAIQKVFREVDSQELAKALKGEREEIREKVFRNMSLRAAQMLKEDIEFMGPIRTSYVKESQEKIVQIIHRLEQTGEIVVPLSKGETVE